MLTTQIIKTVKKTDRMSPLSLPSPVEVQFYNHVSGLLANLSPDLPWAERKEAAQELGRLRDRSAVPALIKALLVDPFWMVRCAIAQALEAIGDRRALPALRKAAQDDSFQIVRSYTAKAADRLS